MSLVIEDLRVAYGGITAVDGVSLEVGSGEIVAIVGPSGSGKSTILRAVAGLETISSGRVMVGGDDLAGVPIHQRGVGLMFQDHALFVHRTVAANVAYGLEVAGWATADRERRVVELLELVGMSGYESRAVDQLSGGESQRVALARALAPRPSVLLLDEPLGSLDRLLRDQLVEDLDQLLREVGQTALYVTHDQTEAFGLADRICVLSNGLVQQIGRPDELWRQPESGFVARFLGHPNVWKVARGSGHPVLERLAAVHDGLVMVPVDAVTIVDSSVESFDLAAQWGPPIVGVVRSCRFNQGVYDLTVDLGDNRTEVGGGAPLTVVGRVAEAFQPGADVQVFIDASTAVRLSGGVN